MVNNHAIAKRLNIDFTNLSEIEDNHPIWKLIGYYLAQLCLNVTLIMSPEKIIIGGGIMNRRILYGMVQENFIDLLAEYLQHNMFNSDVSEYIVPPGLG